MYINYIQNKMQHERSRYIVTVVSRNGRKCSFTKVPRDLNCNRRNSLLISHLISLSLSSQSATRYLILRQHYVLRKKKPILKDDRTIVLLIIVVVVLEEIPLIRGEFAARYSVEIGAVKIANTP